METLFLLFFVLATSVSSSSCPCRNAFPEEQCNVVIPIGVGTCETIVAPCKSCICKDGGSLTCLLVTKTVMQINNTDGMQCSIVEVIGPECPASTPESPTPSPSTPPTPSPIPLFYESTAFLTQTGTNLQLKYSIDVPGLVLGFHKVVLTGGGSLDLYARYNSLPNPTTSDYDCHSPPNIGPQLCLLFFSTAATLYVLLDGNFTQDLTLLVIPDFGL